MKGYIITTTDNKIIFIETECEYCEMTTGGEHAYNCPNNPKKPICLYPSIVLNNYKEEK